MSATTGSGEHAARNACSVIAWYNVTETDARPWSASNTGFQSWTHGWNTVFPTCQAQEGMRGRTSDLRSERTPDASL